jgi:nucleoside-diphosphate-sugar epimerase
VTKPTSITRLDLDQLRGDLADVLPELAGQRLLITGGAGFLGYYLVHTVADWNQDAAPGDRIDLTLCDNMVRGKPGWLAAVERAPSVRLVVADASRPLPADLGPFDWIIHAAGIASPMVYRRLPLETMDANINGLRWLLDMARSQADQGRPLKGFLFYSSSEIYGDPTPDAIPTPEDYRGNVSCTGPRACYDESKRYGETLCVVFARQYGVRAMMARPFNNYGPGLRIDDGRVIPDFSSAILQGRDIVMHSDGSPTRTFCYSADAIAGYYRVLVKGRAGEAYNIGVETPEVSMKDLALRLSSAARSLTGYQGRVITEASAEADYLVDNPQRRCPVITKARTELGYAPRVDLDEGLRRSLLWYLEQHNGAA